MKHFALLFLAIGLMACGDVSRIVEPNTYKKCTEYSVSRNRHIYLGESDTKDSVEWVMTYDGKYVLLNSVQSARLETDPDSVCKEVM